MELWKLLLITLLSAILLGCIVGVLIGKHQLKKKNPDYKPLLSFKERIVYAACIVLGAGCITFGLFYKSPSTEVPEGMMGMDEQQFGGMLLEDMPANYGDQAVADGGDIPMADGSANVPAGEANIAVPDGEESLTDEIAPDTPSGATDATIPDGEVSPSEESSDDPVEGADAASDTEAGETLEDSAASTAQTSNTTASTSQRRPRGRVSGNAEAGTVVIVG